MIFLGHVCGYQSNIVIVLVCPSVCDVTILVLHSMAAPAFAFSMAESAYVNGVAQG